MFIRAYLRASTKEQDPNRAKATLQAFAEQQGQKIAAYYSETESGTKRERPELQRLLNDAHEGDILLIEQVDRLSRLEEEDWGRLKTAISEAGLRIASIDLPTSHTAFTQGGTDEFTNNMLKAINNMLLDMLAAIARKDYEDRRRRQAEGIGRNKDKFKGRPADKTKQEKVVKLKRMGHSLTEVQEITGYSRSSVARILKEHREG